MDDKIKEIIRQIPDKLLEELIGPKDDENFEKKRESFEAAFEEIQQFRIADVRDETHLRTMIADRVLETALQRLAMKVGDRKVPLEELPEEKQEEALAELMEQVFGDVEGPGPVLRRAIARMVLDYRMALRLQKAMETMKPGSRKIENAQLSFFHLETTLAMSLIGLRSWPMARDERDSREARRIKEAMSTNLKQRLLFAGGEIEGEAIEKEEEN
ncbi:MAG: hypothetical protein LBQ90_10580 [Synergistaceae bacterium]|jgi:hypothetical protein|nr:hypothetical protein [Synergistaceae bacterium]